MVYCPKCGKENPDNASFCINCGTEIKKEEIEEFEPIATGVQPSKSDLKYNIGVAIAIITCIIVIMGLTYPRLSFNTIRLITGILAGIAFASVIAASILSILKK